MTYQNRVTFRTEFFGLEVEVEADVTPPARGMRGTYGPLEPDEPASAALLSVTPAQDNPDHFAVDKIEADLPELTDEWEDLAVEVWIEEQRERAEAAAEEKWEMKRDERRHG